MFEFGLNNSNPVVEAQKVHQLIEVQDKSKMKKDLFELDFTNDQSSMPPVKIKQNECTFENTAEIKERLRDQILAFFDKGS